ncbi:hypothetical protein FRB90_009886 [Tulasnella sp. 427]|nr:hypothetical protein FRB90_009886 [Tulasnella sp. 427]
MSAGCVTLPNATIYSTPVSTSWSTGYSTSTMTYPGATETVTAWSTTCYNPIIYARADGRHIDRRQLDCPFGTTLVEYTTYITYPAWTSDYLELHDDINEFIVEYYNVHLLFDIVLVLILILILHFNFDIDLHKLHYHQLNVLNDILNVFDHNHVSQQHDQFHHRINNIFDVINK